MATVGNLITDALRLIGVIASGEAPTAAEQSDALRSLNRMTSSWSVEGLLIYQKTREVFPLISNQASYTFGPLGDFASSRPVNIEIVNVLVSGNEMPVKILSTSEWAAISNKATTSNSPTSVYAEGTYPLETLHLHPVPTDANQLVIYSDKAITSFASAADVIAFPEGYEDAFLYNLAIRLAPEFGKPIDPYIKDTADKSKAVLKRKNGKNLFLTSDTSGVATRRRSANIMTGGWN